MVFNGFTAVLTSWCWGTKQELLASLESSYRNEHPSTKAKQRLGELCRPKNAGRYTQKHPKQHPIW